MLFIDTETCGLHGVPVLIQYVKDDEEDIILYEIWNKTARETIRLIEWMINEESKTGLVFFNATFDWFHLCKLYTTLVLMEPNCQLPLRKRITEFAILEEKARDGVCLKPHKTLDLFLHARKTEYQTTMERKDIRIRRVPTVLAYQLAQELDKRIQLPDIYFARKKKDKEVRWEVEESNKKNPDPNFKNVVLKFKASSALKALAVDALDVDPDDIMYYSQAGCSIYPKECGWAPFALALGKIINLDQEDLNNSRVEWNGAWPSVINHHIDYWASNTTGREYATKDVYYTRELYRYFGKPEMNDDDSILACQVSAARWRGHKIDLSKIIALREKLVKLTTNKTAFDPDYVPHAPAQVQRYIAEVMEPPERMVFLQKNSTSKVILQELAKQTEENPETGVPEPLPYAIRAKKVLQKRDANYDIGIYDKLIQAGRLHASYKVIGTLSGRMSGTDDLNVTGFKRTKEVRSSFPLAWDNDGLILTGGDFESFEVALAAAAYGDPKLIEDLSKCWRCGHVYHHTEFLLLKCPGCGQSDGDENTRCKIHALFAMELFPGNNYEDILRSKKTVLDMYSLGKNGVFTMIYGGTKETLTNKYGIPAEVAERAEISFGRKYPMVKIAREKLRNALCTMKQPGGIGTKVVWAEPQEYVESMLGFRRYFTLENQICKALFDLANKPPESWSKLKLQIVRRERVQTVGGALQSALYGCSFGIQSNSMRAGANHVIQSTGAGITKKLQCNIWELQPAGIHEWNVIPLNCHDEVMVPVKPELVPKLEKIVHDTTESYRELVPLIGIGWKSGIKNWSEK